MALIKLGFTTLSCPDWAPEQVLDAAVRLGYDGIEWRLLNGAIIDPLADRAALVRAITRGRERGVDTCALDTSCRFNLLDVTSRARQVTDLLHWIELADMSRVRILRVFGGATGPTNAPALCDDEVDGWVADSLRAVAEPAALAGVMIALETHDDFSSAHRVAAVLREVARPEVGGLWDSHHPFRVGETPDEVSEALGNRLVHVHVKDARRVAPGSDDWQLLPLGTGEVPVRGILETLTRRGYDDWVCVEWEKRWHPELAAPEIALPQHIAWLRTTLSEINA